MNNFVTQNQMSLLQCTLAHAQRRGQRRVPASADCSWRLKNCLSFATRYLKRRVVWNLKSHKFAVVYDTKPFDREYLGEAAGAED